MHTCKDYNNELTKTYNESLIIWASVWLEVSFSTLDILCWMPNIQAVEKGIKRFDEPLSFESRHIPIVSKSFCY